MVKANYVPKRLVRVEEEAFKIIWDDGHESVYPAQHLRFQCPCAACKDEWTGESKLDFKTLPQDLQLKDARLVGNYAVNYLFSDGHSTGIYSFETLRKICPCCIKTVP
ncbi:MAG: DUF971 domain-containing protein [Elusimicrobia bacterium]|nr:DUF971 domain-containing protein [Elusimicrobiota bacterium]